MRLRSLLLAALLVGGFLYLTSGKNWSPRRLFQQARSSGPPWSAPDVARSAGLSSDEVNNIDIYKMAHHATVNISSVVYQRGWFFEVIPQKGVGSGFLIDSEGRILTNHHVVSGPASQIQVALADQSRYRAQVLATDPYNDLALIKISPKKKLQFLALGDSDTLRVGQKVLAIGNPFGQLEGTLTTGVVSSLGRTIRDENDRELEGTIQTDAAINPGNSGGPLLDSQGSVVGINTAILGGTNIGIGFAMPINRAKVMLEEFQAKGRFVPPRLGVRIMYVAGDLAEALELPAEGGLLIQTVDRGSAAEAAGLGGAREVVVVGNYEIGVGGDLITAIDGRRVEGRETLNRVLGRKRPGDPLELTVFRNGRTRKVRIRLGEAAENL